MGVAEKGDTTMVRSSVESSLITDGTGTDGALGHHAGRLSSLLTVPVRTVRVFALSSSLISSSYYQCRNSQYLPSLRTQLAPPLSSSSPLPAPI